MNALAQVVVFQAIVAIFLQSDIEFGKVQQVYTSVLIIMVDRVVIVVAYFAVRNRHSQGIRLNSLGALEAVQALMIKDVDAALEVQGQSLIYDAPSANLEAQVVVVAAIDWNDSTNVICVQIESSLTFQALKRRALGINEAVIQGSLIHTNTLD